MGILLVTIFLAPVQIIHLQKLSFSQTLAVTFAKLNSIKFMRTITTATDIDPTMDNLPTVFMQIKRKIQFSVRNSILRIYGRI